MAKTPKYNTVKTDKENLQDKDHNQYHVDQLYLDEGISSKTISKKFGREEDYIELHIYNINDELIISDLQFKGYELP